MTSTTLDLWPPDLEPTDIVSPVAILRSQALVLGDRTDHRLQGSVVTRLSHSNTRLSHVFSLVSPALSGYQYALLTVSHDFNLYPLIVRAFDDLGEEADAPDRDVWKCDTEQDFIATLQTIFSDERTLKIIAVLLAQSKTVRSG